MSIEESLAKLSEAIEALASVVGKIPGQYLGENAVSLASQAVPPPAPAVPVDILPGQEAEPVTAVGPAGVTLGAATIKTGADLRDYVGKHLEVAEKKGFAQELITFVREKVCPKFNPKEPKLIKIPEKNLAEAAQMVYDWCAQRQIVVG